MLRTPTPILAFALLLSLLTALSSAGGVVLAALGREWYMLAFQAVSLIASVMGVLIGANRIRTGHAIGMFCTGGVVSVAALLAQPAIVGDLVEKKAIPAASVAGVNIVPMVAGSVFVGISLIVLAGLTVLVRKPGRSVPLLFTGMLLGLPVAAAGGSLALHSVRGALLGMNPLVQTILVIVGTIVLGVLCAISGHCLIRAFEIGALSEPSAGAPKAAEALVRAPSGAAEPGSARPQ